MRLHPFTFTVSLSLPSSQDVAVTYQTEDGTATAGDTDYVPVSGTLIIPAGETSGVIVVNVVGDTKFESNETFTVRLTDADNAALPEIPSGTGTIANDDMAPTIRISDVAVNEGDNGQTEKTFTASLSNASGVPATVA